MEEAHCTTDCLIAVVRGSFSDIRAGKKAAQKVKPFARPCRCLNIEYIRGLPAFREISQIGNGA
jgi:hypothetical protein